MLIAVVDDDDSARDAVAGLLRALGQGTMAFRSAAECLACEDLRRVGCIVTDLRMPEMSGLDLHRRLAAAGFAMPTIVMTAYPDEISRVRALEAGVVAYLAKPVRADDLLAALDTLVAPRPGPGRAAE